MSMSENEDNFFCNGWEKISFPEDQHCINYLKKSCSTQQNLSVISGSLLDLYVLLEPKVRIWNTQFPCLYNLDVSTQGLDLVNRFVRVLFWIIQSKN